MPDIYRDIGLRVRWHRKRLGWTQEELGERCRMHPSYVGQIERGVKKISISSLEKIAGALRIRMAELLEEDPVLPETWESKIGGLLRDKPEDERRVLYSTLRHLAREIRRKPRR
ncbi:helix-turn-helix domain-containing protein [Elusimicrobiota bacterium]